MTSYFKQPQPPKPPRKPLPRRSKKRARQEAQYRADRIVFLSARPLCEMRLGVCLGRASEVHHQRGRVGSLLTDQRWWMAACGPCHHEATVNPQMAYERGLSFHRNGEP